MKLDLAYLLLPPNTLGSINQSINLLLDCAGY